LDNCGWNCQSNAVNLVIELSISAGGHVTILNENLPKKLAKVTESEKDYKNNANYYEHWSNHY
jgi:predicted hydrocarbon binding protein